MNVWVKVNEDLPRQVADHMNLSALKRLVTTGEGPQLEFKRSTGELREGLEAVCAFLNTAGGCVLFGVNRKGGIEGQQVSEQTIHEITAGFDRFEPPAVVKIEEIWGRGTNRVIEECRRYGIPPPKFEERGGTMVVTFRAPIGPGAKGVHQVSTKPALSEHQVLVLTIANEPQPIQTLMRHCGRADRTKFRNQVLRPLLDAGLLAMTVPDKPTSSQQRYLTTEAGRAALKE